jgi:hypothetical protein
VHVSQVVHDYLCTLLTAPYCVLPAGALAEHMGVKHCLQACCCHM